MRRAADEEIGVANSLSVGEQPRMPWANFLASLIDEGRRPNFGFRDQFAIGA